MTKRIRRANRARPEAEKIKERIEWQLGCLEREREQLSENDLRWAIIIQDSYKKRGGLSSREREILDNMYTRYA